MRPRFGHARTGSVVGTVLGLLACAGLFVVSVYLFRSRAGNAARESRSATTSPAAETRLADQPPQTAELSGVDGVQGSGTVTRETKNGQQAISVRATPPAIDRQAESYEAWLLRRRPFAFTRLGEMVTDETGTFVLDWTSGDSTVDAFSYPTVIITREAKDGNPDPGVHTLTGTFK